MRCVIGLAGAAVLAVCVSAQGGIYRDGIVVFGDSLSDPGNVSIASGGFVPGPHYHEGRFADGPVWVERLGDAIGLDASTPALAGGSNYAFGGVQTQDTPGPAPGIDFIDMDQQVEMYLSGLGGPGRPPNHDLFVLWGGANDFLMGTTQDQGIWTPRDPAIAAGNIASQIALLNDAGARNFLVPNLPPLGMLPALRGTPGEDALNDLAAAFNLYLDAELDDLESERGNLRLFRMDAGGLIDDILSNPGEYGLTNATDPAASGLEPGGAPISVVDNPEEYFFWDDGHISAAAHQLLSEEAIRTLADLKPRGQYRNTPLSDVHTPEPGAAAALLLAGTLLLRRRARQSQGRL